MSANRSNLADDRYRAMAVFYDLLAMAYSGDRIEECKAGYIGRIDAAEHVLFAGAGTGADVVAAQRRGAEVVAIDTSAAMLARLRRRVGPDTGVDLVHADIFAVDRPARFHWVFANFFLNVFTETDLPRVIEHLARFLLPGGYFVVGDFAAPEGRGLSRLAQEIHYGAPLLAFRILTGTPLHGLHDYTAPLASAGLRVEERRTFKAFGYGPRWYASLLARKA